MTYIRAGIDIMKGSRSAFCRRILKKYPIEPMMKQREIRIIEEVLRKLKPKKVLEWGSGYSTLYYPELLEKSATWEAIEHDISWGKIVKEKNKNKNVAIRLIKPNLAWSGKDGDGSYDQFKDYIEYPKKNNQKYDMILIDGRARAECFKIAKSILSKNGVIIIHDANRRHYYNKFKFKTKQKVVFYDVKSKHGGIFLYNEKDIGKYLDIKEHKKIWKKFNKIEKIPVLGQYLHRLS